MLTLNYRGLVYREAIFKGHGVSVGRVGKAACLAVFGSVGMVLWLSPWYKPSASISLCSR